MIRVFFPSLDLKMLIMAIIVNLNKNGLKLVPEELVLIEREH